MLLFALLASDGASTSRCKRSLSLATPVMATPVSGSVLLLLLLLLLTLDSLLLPFIYLGNGEEPLPEWTTDRGESEIVVQSLGHSRNEGRAVSRRDSLRETLFARPLVASAPDQLPTMPWIDQMVW